MKPRTLAVATAPNGATIELTRTILMNPYQGRYTWPTFQYRVNGKTLWSGDLPQAWSWFKWAREMCGKDSK